MAVARTVRESTIDRALDGNNLSIQQYWVDDVHSHIGSMELGRWISGKARSDDSHIV